MQKPHTDAAKPPAHTPTPWYRDHDYIRDESSDALIARILEGGNAAQEQFINRAEREANAARIVQCVNGWDALAAERDALRGALEEIEDECNAMHGHSDVPKALIRQIARRALALARGEE